MRSTNKEVKEMIQEYIKGCLSEDETTVLTEQLNNVVTSFNSWSNGYETKRTPNHQARFKQFMMCLPSELSLDYTYYMMESMLIKWLGEPKKEYSTDQIETQFHWLVYREFTALCKKNNVAFM